MKIQLTILCGTERTNWVAPELVFALSKWLTTPAQGPNGEPVGVLYRPAMGYRQSQIARNDACRWALENEVDYLVMIDNDTIPVTPGGGIVDIVGMCKSNLPIIGSPVPVIKGDDDWHLNVYDRGPLGYTSLAPQELVEGASEDNPAIKVDAVGFGLVCIKADVIKGLAESVDALHIDEGGNLCRTECPPGFPVHRNRDWDGRTELGEDLLFCLRAKELLNAQTFTMPSQMCGHYHTIDYAKVPMIGYPKTALDYGIVHYAPQITNYTMQTVVLDYLRRLILSKPNQIWSVFELGSGMSTLVVQAALAQHRLSGHLHIALEEDPGVASMINSAIKANGWRHAQNSNVVMYEPMVGGWYADDRYSSIIELLIVDGPSEAAGGDRTKCLALIQHRMQKGAVVLFDDWERPKNKAAIEYWVTNKLVRVEQYVGRAVVLVRL